MANDDDLAQGDLWDKFWREPDQSQDGAPEAGQTDDHLTSSSTPAPPEKQPVNQPAAAVVRPASRTGPPTKINPRPRASAQPSSTPAAPKKGRFSAFLIVIVVVLIITTVAGWMIAKPQASMNSTTGATSSQAKLPTTAKSVTTSGASAVGKTVPTNLLYGLPHPDSIRMLGIWSGVAVFSLNYAPTSTVAISTSMLRAVRVASGEILWTYDTLPNGAPFQFNHPVNGFLGDLDVTGVSADVWNGNIALTTGPVWTDTTKPSTTTCWQGGATLIFDLDTGKPVAAQWYDLNCEAKADGSTSGVSVSLKAYRNSTVVVTQDDSRDGTTTTLAYRDTDLATPVWQIGDDSSQEAVASLDSSDPVLGDRWVFIDGVQGYVSISDGTSTPLMTALKQTAKSTLIPVGTLLIQALPGSDGLTGSFAAWSSPPADTKPAWTFVADPSSDLTLACSTSTMLVVLETNHVGSTLTYSAAGISLEDGSLKWTITNLDRNFQCKPIDRDNQELIGFVQGTNLNLADAASGTLLAQKAGAFDQGDQSAGTFDTSLISWDLESCQTFMMCLVSYDMSSPSPSSPLTTITVTAFDPSSADLETHWSGMYSLEIIGQVWDQATDDGLVIPFGDPGTGMSFLII